MLTNPSSGVSGLAGDYFTFNNPATSVNYYIWFTVNGSGADPAISGATGLKVNLFSTMTQDELTNSIICAFSGFMADYISCIAASSITPGAYFNFETPTTGANYYTWYTVDGNGDDPQVIGAIGLLVELVSSDTAVTVATKTLQVINSYSFATPDCRGVFLRGFDDAPSSVKWDYEQYISPTLTIPTRFGNFPGRSGNLIGTLENFTTLSHNHSTEYVESGTATPDYTPFAENITLSTTENLLSHENGTTGYLAVGVETRPINISVRYLLRI